MVTGKAGNCRRLILSVATAAALISLGGCNPIEAYRNLTGVSKNDPNPATTPNTQNLAAGEQSPYPNLATVPEPPTQALTAAERDKLTRSLVADRTNVKHTSEQLQAGIVESAGAPPPPPPAPLPVPPTPGSAAPAKAATLTLPAAVGGGSPPAAPSAAAPPSAVPSATATPSASPAGGPSSATPSAATPPSAGRVANAAPATAEKGPRKSGQPPEPGPMELSLQSPQIGSLPQAEASLPAPPPPPQLDMPAASTAGGKPGSAHLPGPPAAAPMPPAIASAQFQPPPPPPVLPPLAATLSAAATGAGKSARQPAAPPVDTPVAQVDFAGDSTALTDADRQRLAKVVPLYRRNPGKVRVVGYTGVGNSADQQLNGFQAALDRAQAVAAALAKAGIPSDKILVEAAPAGAGPGQSHAVVMLEH